MALYRRMAVNRVVAGGKTVSPCLLEINDGVVVSFSHLSEEQPFTEWIGGTVVLARAGDAWIIESSTAESLLL